MPAPASCPPPGEIRVWHGGIDDVFRDRDRIGRARTWLEPAADGRYERYRHDADRHMFLLGRVMARSMVSAAAGWTPTAWQWQEGPHGRPEIAAPPTDLRFNLAHSAGIVVCALANGHDVGIDLEDLERPPIDPDLVRRYCAPAEADDIEAQGPDGWRDRFLHYWTLKEAYLKARGLGISVHLADICFTLDGDRARIAFLGSLAGSDDQWTFRIGRLTPRHLMAVAAPVASAAFRLDIAPFPESALP